MRIITRFQHNKVQFVIVCIVVVTSVWFQLISKPTPYTIVPIELTLIFKVSKHPFFNKEKLTSNISKFLLYSKHSKG